MSNATATVTYRKTKTGEWVAYGPATHVRELRPVVIRKASGDTDVRIVDRVGRTFEADGVEMVYGYLRAEERTSSASECDNGHRRYVPSCFCCRHEIGQ